MPTVTVTMDTGDEGGSTPVRPARQAGPRGDADGAGHPGSSWPMRIGTAVY